MTEYKGFRTRILHKCVWPAGRHGEGHCGGWTTLENEAVVPFFVVVQSPSFRIRGVMMAVDCTYSPSISLRARWTCRLTSFSLGQEAIIAKDSLGDAYLSLHTIPWVWGGACGWSRERLKAVNQSIKGPMAIHGHPWPLLHTPLDSTTSPLFFVGGRP